MPMLVPIFLAMILGAALMIVGPKSDHHLTFLGLNISHAAVKENK